MLPLEVNVSDKIKESLDFQRKQLDDLVVKFAQMGDAIQQLKGSIAALEYVQGLGLVEPTQPQTDSSSQVAS